MNNDKIDLSREALNNEGNIWLNRQTKQLRTSFGKNEPNSWYNPISVYEVGSEDKIKKGQPVSVGFLDQLYSESKLSGDSCIVPTNPSINQWCIGLALEPGFHRNGNELKKIHVQSFGQIEYKLSNKDDDNYYLPPHTETEFLWTYDDIGKAVYVSNKNKGELTLDIAEAAFNGGTIVCVGRIADAPLVDEKNIDLQKITIEVQLSGDTRGVVDTSQIQVEIASEAKHNSLGIRVENIESSLDRIFFFFIKDNLAYFILDDEVINRYPQNAPIGAYVISSTDNSLNLTSFLCKKVLITRLGLLKGNFGYSKIGNTAYLSNGKIDENSPSSSYDYKIGVIFSEDSVLIDCRYPRFVAKKTMIGNIKPLFDNGLCEPGYAKIDDKVHKVVFDKNDPICSDGINWYDLVLSAYTKDLFLFSRSSEGPFTSILEGNWTPEGAGEDSTGFLNKYTYFKFKNLFYSVDNEECGCQIKFSKDDSPDAMNYIWPEQTFNLSLIPEPGMENNEDYVIGGNLERSNLKIDITKLVSLGYYMDSNGTNIEAYDIFVREKESNQLVSPGFYQIKDKDTMKWCGYEWRIVQDSHTKQTFIVMVTIPGEFLASECLGFCWPIGKKITKKVDLLVTVRRKPTQYHDLYLNQLNNNNPWAPYTDGQNLITNDSIYFGAKLRESQPEPSVGQNSGYEKENIGAGLLSLSSSEHDGFAKTVITEVDSDSNKINVLHDIKAIATRNENDNIRRYIEWIYDFNDNVTSLSSAFAPSLVQPSTAQSFIEDGHSEYEYSEALKILHELKPQVISYKSDDDFTKANWKKISILFNDVVAAASSSEEYEIFDNDTVQASKYQIDDKTKESIVKATKYLYGSSNGYLSYITNIGLLNAAAKDTQNRLLKLERALFGADFETNPSGQLAKDEQLVNINETISNEGILRELLAIKNLGVISKESNHDRALDLVNGFSSVLKEFFATNYMEYNDYFSYSEGLEDFNIISAFTENSRNHLYTLWLDFINRDNINYQLSRRNSIKTYAPQSIPYKLEKGDFKEVPSSMPANRIFLHKYLEKYNFENKEISNEEIRLNENYGRFSGTFLQWPLYHDSDFEDVNFSRIFMRSGVCGLDDSYTIKREGEQDTIREPSFNAQSLEGLILDVYSKLSYIRKSAYNEDGTLKSDLFDKMLYLTVDSYDDQFDFSSAADSFDDGVYSAFSLSNGHLEKGLKTNIEKTYNTQYFNNSFIFNTAEANDEAGKCFDLLRKFKKQDETIIEDYYQVFAEIGIFTLIYYFIALANDDLYSSNQDVEEVEDILYGSLELFVPQAYLDNEEFVIMMVESVFNDDGAQSCDIDRELLEETEIKDQKDLIEFYYNHNNIKTLDTTVNGNVLSSNVLHLLCKAYLNYQNARQICEKIYPSFENAPSGLRRIFGYTTKIVYEKSWPIVDNIQSVCFEMSSHRIVQDRRIFIDYENKTDDDQKTLTDSSNNINDYLTINVIKDSVYNKNHFEKVDEHQGNIIYDFYIRNLLTLADNDNHRIIKEHDFPDSFYLEESTKLNDLEIPRNESQNDGIYLGVSSLKEQIEKLKNSLSSVFEDPIDNDIYKNNFKTQFRDWLDGIINEIDNSRPDGIASGSFKREIEEFYNEEFESYKDAYNKLQGLGIDQYYDTDEDYKEYIDASLQTLKESFNTGNLLDLNNDILLSTIKEGFEKISNQISDLDITNINELTLQVSNSQTPDAIKISKKGKVYNTIEVKSENFRLIDDIFDNSMVRELDKLNCVKEDDGSNSFTFTGFDVLEYIKTTYKNEIFAILNTFEVFEASEDFDYFLPDANAIISNRKVTKDILLQTASLFELKDIVSSKINFIFKLFDEEELVIKDNILTFKNLINAIYSALITFYNSKVDLYLNNEENKLRVKSNLSEGFKIFGKQQKIPEIAFKLDSKSIADALKLTFEEGKEVSTEFESKKYDMIFDLSKCYKIVDVNSKAINIYKGDEKYRIRSFFLITVDGLHKDDLLHLVIRDNLYGTDGGKFSGFYKDYFVKQNFILIPDLAPFHDEGTTTTVGEIKKFDLYSSSSKDILDHKAHKIEDVSVCYDMPNEFISQKYFEKKDDGSYSDMKPIDTHNVTVIEMEMNFNELVDIYDYCMPVRYQRAGYLKLGVSEGSSNTYDSSILDILTLKDLKSMGVNIKVE